MNNPICSNQVHIASAFHCFIGSDNIAGDMVQLVELEDGLNPSNGFPKIKKIRIKFEISYTKTCILLKKLTPLFLSLLPGYLRLLSKMVAVKIDMM